MPILFQTLEVDKGAALECAPGVATLVRAEKADRGDTLKWNKAESHQSKTHSRAVLTREALRRS